MIGFKAFLKGREPLPAIETTGLSSNQANTAMQDNNTPAPMMREKVSYEDQLHNELSEHYWHQSEHRKTLNYLAHGSYGVNKKLHTRYKEGKDPKSHVSAEGNHTKKIDAALKQHKTPHDFHVYTGVKHDVKPGVYHHPGYLHTSLNHETAQGFARTHSTSDKPKELHNHILKIHVPKGHHGSYVAHIAHEAAHSEREFILPRNTKLHIHPGHETHIEHFHGYDRHTHTHHATIEQ